MVITCEETALSIADHYTLMNTVRGWRGERRERERERKRERNV